MSEKLVVAAMVVGGGQVDPDAQSLADTIQEAIAKIRIETDANGVSRIVSH